MDAVKLKPSIEARVLLRHPLKVPVLFGGATFLLALAYLAWILFEMPGQYALKVVKHSPHYSMFYLIFMPLITALTVYCGMEVRIFSRLSAWFRLLGVLSLLLVLTLSLYDAMDKSTPIPISNLSFPTPALREAAIDSETAIRKTAWTRNDSGSYTSDSAAMIRYKSAVGEILGVPPDAIQTFSSPMDFFRRGSALALFEFALSSWGAGIALYFFLILIYTLLAKPPGDDRMKHCFFMLFWLWTTWFPARGYSMWYQSFYTANGFGNAMLVAAVLAIYALLLTNLVARKKPIKGALTAVFGVLCAVFPVIAKVKPEYVASLGDRIDSLPVLVYMIIELLTLATLGTFVWVYFNQSPVPDPQPRSRRN